MWVYKQERRPGMEIAKSRSRRYFFIDRCEPPTPPRLVHTVVPAADLFCPWLPLRPSVLTGGFILSVFA